MVRCPRPRDGILRLVAALAGALILLGLSTGTAQAQLVGGVGSVQAADADGVPSDSFATNEYLFANVRAGLRGGQICVLPAIFYDDVESNSLTCGENEDAYGADPDYAPWTTPNTVSGAGELQIMPIEAPPLKQPELAAEREDGDYFILGDQGQVATVDVCCDVRSQIFSVRDCEEDCDTTIGRAAAEQYKESARLIAFPVNGAPIADNLACKAAGAILLGGLVHGGLIALSGLGYSVVGSTVSVVGAGGFGLWGFTAIIGVETTAMMSAMAAVRFVNCRRAQMWRDIANDPPDYRYDEIVQPQFTALPPLGDPLADAIAVTDDRITAYGRAQLTSYERYQGAVEQGASAAASRQAAATSRYGLQMVRAIRRHVAQLRKLARESQDAPDPLLTPEARDAAAGAYDRVRTSGFNDSERERLQELGLSGAEIEELRHTLDDYDVRDAPVNRSLSQLVEEIAAGWDDVIPGLLAFSRQAGFVAENTAPPVPGTVIVRESTVPPGSAQRFSYSSPAGGFDLADGESKRIEAAPGELTVTGYPASGYSLTAVECDDGSPGSVSSSTATVTLTPGETVTCTFTHERAATIVVKSVTAPADELGRQFLFDVAGQATFGLADGERRELVLPAGEHDVLYRGAEGATLDAIACDDGDSTGAVQSSTATVRAAPGETVTCTFTSVLSTGRVVLDTTSTPPGAQPAVAEVQGPFGPVQALVGNPASFDVEAGPLTLAVTPAAGAHVASYTCGGSFTVHPGQVVHCALSVVHDNPGRITIGNRVDASVIDPAQEFPFRGPAPLNLFALPHGAQRSVAVWPGAYSVERMLPGNDYTWVGPTCDDDDSHAAQSGAQAEVIVAAGEQVSCTFGWAPVAMMSAGPLRRVLTTPDLACGVFHVKDRNPEFFADTACGTFLRAGDATYGPQVPAGPSVVALTPVSRSAPAGAGTRADPLRVVTEAVAGETGLRIRQTDAYVVGEEAYKTTVEVVNESGQSRSGRLYRAADCYLQDSDAGMGDLDLATGAVGCRGVVQGPDGPIRGERIEQWFPLTPGSRAFQAGYATVWGRVASGDPFDDTCTCDTWIDNGAGLQWDYALAPGARATFAHLTTFSPLGRKPLLAGATATPATVIAGGRVDYELSVGNDNETDVGIEAASFTLPPGFVYVPGSTQGAGEPAVAGRTLTWASPGTAPAAGRRAIRFGALVALEPGAYDGEAAADPADPFVGIPSGPTARVTVTADDVKPTVDLRSPPEGARYARGAVAAADFSCSDAGSGIAGCTGTVADGAPVDTAKAGTHVFEVVAVDRAGNRTVVRHTYEVTTPPTPTPTPTPTPSATATPTPTPKPQVQVKGEQAVSLGLPATRRCVSRRRFPIRLRAPKGAKLRSARVWVDGKRVKVTRKHGRLTALIDLRGMRKGRFGVVVRAVTADGRKLRDDRRYRTCAKRRKPA